MKRLKSFILIALAVVVAGAYAVPAPSAAAQSSSLSIAPKKEYVIEPGDSVDDKLTIRNLDNSADLTLSLRVVDFTFTDDGGTPKLFLEDDAPQTTWSLKPFVTVPKTVTVPKSGSKTLDMSVAFPAGHGAGSYYSAIVYSTSAPDGAGNVGLAASGVTLVFAQVPGKVNENLKLEKFGAYQQATANKEAGYFFMSLLEPQRVAYTLKNNGNVTAAPVGSITLKNMFGKTYEISNVNPSGSLALIGQSRTYTACIKLASQNINFSGDRTSANTCVSAGLWPGYYSADLNLFYGQNGNPTQEIISKASFWYLPWWFLIIVFVVLLLLAYIVWRITQAVRNRSSGSIKLKKRK